MSLVTGELTPRDTPCASERYTGGDTCGREGRFFERAEQRGLPSGYALNAVIRPTSEQLDALRSPPSWIGNQESEGFDPNETEHSPPMNEAERRGILHVENGLQQALRRGTVHRDSAQSQYTGPEAEDL